MKITTLGAAAAVMMLAATPASADPITAPQAVTELTAAVNATNDADSYFFTDTALGWTASFNRSTGQYEQDATDRMKVFSSTGTYWAIRWPSTRVRTKVQGADYLDNSALEWQLLTAPISGLEIPLWPDIVDPLGERRGLIYRPPMESEIAYADKTMIPGGTRYTIGNTYYEAIYSVDVAGRITRLENTRAAGSPVSGQVQTWDYVPVAVTAPPAASVLPYATVARAIEAATLNTTLRGLARDIASFRSRNLARMRVMARETIVIYNAGGEDEQVPVYVKLKIRNVPGGVRLYRKNPLTGTFHEWRVTARGSSWRAFKTAP